MMLSRPIASGAMLILLIGAAGAAAWQGSATPEAGIAEISDPERPIADAAEPAAEQATEVEQRSATAPNRVVDSAGFPVVSQAERDKATGGPIVTVNGQPLDGAPAATETEVAPEVEDEPVPVVETTEPSETQTQVAAIEPPLPRPRPAGLAVQSGTPALDYDAIAEAGFGAPEGPIALPQEPRPLEPMPGASNFDPRSGFDRNQDELVGVVGPNGEIIWVYEDQVPGMNSRVTIQRQQQQPANPFGFIYE